MNKAPAALAALTLFAVIAGAQEPSAARYKTAANGAVSASALTALSADLEQRFETYNRLFRFDPAMLPAPLNVTLFDSPQALNAYAAARAATRTETDAVYFHYEQPEQRELVLLEGASGLSYQAFLQFFRAFVPNPPAWMLQGFALYFSGLESGGSKLEYRENLEWLPLAKKLLAADTEGTSAPRLDLDAVLRGEAPGVSSAEAGTEFQALSWALVSFFLSNTGNDYFRALTDSFMLLRADADTAANTLAVYRRFGLFGDTDTLRAALAAYTTSRKTFAELLAEGEAALNAEDETRALAFFTEAAGRRNENPAPLYYLGVLAYRRKDYTGAQARYTEALQKGADRALIQYSQGMCADAQGDIEGARKLLEEAANGGGDERYRKLARDLLKRM